MLAVKNNAFHLVEALCLKFKIVNVCEVRGLVGEFELLKREKYNLSNWNMILVAVAFDHLNALKFFTQKLICHMRVSLRSPPLLGFSKIQESSPQQSEAFSLLVAVNNRNEAILKFLWNDLHMLWDSFHLQYIIEEMGYHKYSEGIRLILKSEVSHDIYQSMRTQEKISFLNDLIIFGYSKRSLEVKEALKEELSQHPYATIAVFVMINDLKNPYTNYQSHLDQALNNMKPIEYAKYKFSAKANGQFMEVTTKRINDYAGQDDNMHQRKFAENIRAKMDHLDQEIVKLKHGFANATEYEDILLSLIPMCEKGELAEFSKTVQDNDIRVFKRKRLETVKLTASFAVNRYCAFTPLLWAIQNKHLSIVTFIMEKMKICLRQALCLQAAEGEENFMSQDVNEEYQAYSLLVASANKDEQMLRYLWDTHGSYLWTERHFEPLMRYLIESEWHDGIRIIFRSDLTQQMIKAFTSEERSFFIENIIGDIFSVDKPSSVGQPISAVLKEELSLKPYAGLFIVYLIDKFELLTKADFESFWTTATNNLYIQELKVISKTNQSNFSKFILDYMVKRRDDDVKFQAMKFIERLKELPEYESIIEEGIEEAIQVGDEEIKFLRKDLKDCQLEFIKDFVKYTIMGNVKQLQTIVEKEKLTENDFYDIRGLAVKAYDNDHVIINTREWNPAQFAIFFRQLKTLQYFVSDLKINLKIALDFSHTYNEFIEDDSLRDFLKAHNHLYGMLLAIYTRDLPILKYLYEDQFEALQLSDQDLIILMKLCISTKFPQGFAALFNSPQTTFIFVNATLDFKEDFVQYVLSPLAIESPCINPNKNPDIVRQVKERLCNLPFSSTAWVYLDFNDDKNQRYVRMLLENFDINSMQILAQGGQLEKLENKILRPQIGIDFLANIKDEGDKKDMEEKHQMFQIEREQLLAHQKKFTSKIEEIRKNRNQADQFVTRNQLNDICQGIVEEVLMRNELNEDQKLEQFSQRIGGHRKVQFVDGFYNFSFWRKYPKLTSIDMDKLNMIHWLIFSNQSNILENILIKKQIESENFHLGIAFQGDQVQFEYEFKEKSEGDQPTKTLLFQNLGIVVSILQRSQNCWAYLLKNYPGLFSVSDIMNATIMICAEDWKQGINPLVPLLESAFLKLSLQKRIEFITQLLRVNTNCFKDVIRIERILTFVEWMYENIPSEHFELNFSIKQLLPSFQATKDRELKKIDYLARHKPKKLVNPNPLATEPSLIQQMPNDIINLNEIVLRENNKKQKKLIKMQKRQQDQVSAIKGQEESGDESADIQTD